MVATQGPGYPMDATPAFLSPVAVPQTMALTFHASSTGIQTQGFGRSDAYARFLVRPLATSIPM